MNIVPIKTSRLTIAPPLYFKDGGHYYLDDLHEIYSDLEFQAYLGNPSHRVTREYIAMLINEENENCRSENYGMQMIYENQLDQIVGIVQIQQSPMESPRDIEIVYATHTQFRRKHYAKEAVQAVLGNEFKKGMKLIVARVNARNKKSVELLISLGFIRGKDRLNNINSSQYEKEQVFEFTGFTKC